MDALTVSAVAGALNQFLSSAAAEAGKGVWGGLVRLVRSRFPEHESVALAAAQLTPDAGGVTGPSAGGAGAAPSPAVIDLSAELVGLARSDPRFAAELRAWLDEAAQVSVRAGDTVNVIAGNATVHGNVVQGRDIGSVSLG
jgi:hypothetical protein